MTWGEKIATGVIGLGVGIVVVGMTIKDSTAIKSGENGLKLNNRWRL